MKKIILAALLLVSTTALANEYDPVIRHQCQAKGFANGRAYLVQGWTRNTKAEAVNSALNMCVSKGLSDCRIKACYKRVLN